MIGNRKLHPGEHLVEYDLSKKFNVSRSSIREALTMLERDQLIERIPNQGAKVRNFTPKEIYHLYDAIYGLEFLAMEKAIVIMTDEHIEILNNILQDQKISVEREEVKEYYELNEKFHDYIFGITENTFLIEVYQNLLRIALPFRLLTFAQGDNMRLSYEEHKKQTEGLKKGDLSISEKATKDQKERALKSLKNLFPEEDTKCLITQEKL